MGTSKSTFLGVNFSVVRELEPNCFDYLGSGPVAKLSFCFGDPDSN